MARKTATPVKRPPDPLVPTRVKLSQCQRQGCTYTWQVVVMKPLRMLLMCRPCGADHAARDPTAAVYSA